MANFEHPDDDFHDFALPPDIKEVSVPAPLKFAPWHKPRKQYVRQKQWMHHARSTIARLKSEGKVFPQHAVTYLTLPGPDMLDVRMMAEVCESESVQLRYTGFCNVREEEAIRLRRNTSQFHLDLDGTIQKGSAVHAMRLEEIVTHHSEARTMMERGGPYTIVNIDACEPLVNRDASQTARLIDAIRVIIQFQLNETRTPWLLYLTTPVQGEWVDATSLDVLKGEVRKNAASDQVFAETLARLYQDGECIEGFLARSLAEDGLKFCSIFALGVAKWMLHMAEQASFRMLKKESFCYSMLKRQPTFPNMISTCYLFLPVQICVEDKTGLTENGVNSNLGTPPKSAHIHALERSVNLVDLDQLFEAMPTEAKAMAEETKKYLSQLGYDVEDPVSGYDAWLQIEAAKLDEEYGE